MQSDLRKIRTAVSVVILGLALSGLTAFPLERELHLITATFPPDAGGLQGWLLTVNQGITMMYAHYPWIAYGTDWLAFAHLILAVLFIGPWRDPVKNIWVLEFGLIACLGVLPLALICGPIRGISWYWRLVDCSFGILAAIPLALARHWTRAYEASLSSRLATSD